MHIAGISALTTKPQLMVESATIRPPSGFELFYVRNEDDAGWELLEVLREDGLGWEPFMVDRPTLRLANGGNLLLATRGQLLLAGT
jgi:hypothetical protein